MWRFRVEGGSKILASRVTSTAGKVTTNRNSDLMSFVIIKYATVLIHSNLQVKTCPLKVTRGLTVRVAGICRQIMACQGPVLRSSTRQSQLTFLTPKSVSEAGRLSLIRQLENLVKATVTPCHSKRYDKPARPELRV